MNDYACDACKATAEDLHRIVEAITSRRKKGRQERVQAAILDLIQLDERLQLEW